MAHYEADGLDKYVYVSYEIVSTGNGHASQLLGFLESEFGEGFERAEELFDFLSHRVRPKTLDIPPRLD